MRKIRRRKFLVRKPVQFRYLGLVGVPLVILLAGLYYLIYYAVLNEMLIPEAVAVTLLPAMKKVNTVVLISLPLLLWLILRAALVHSNKVVGPLNRLEKELDQAIAGDYNIRIKTRQNDELRSFVSRVNLLLEERGKSVK